MMMMMLDQTFLAVLFLFSTSAWGATFVVILGQNGTLTFKPEVVTAAPGDIIAFTFPTTIKHSVTEGMFDPTCQHNPKPGAIDSKIHVATGGKPFVFNYTVVDTNTRWIYCDVEDHCQDGMVAAINPPTSGNQTFAAYKAKAEGGSPSSSIPSSSSTLSSSNQTTTTSPSPSSTSDTLLTTIISTTTHSSGSSSSSSSSSTSSTTTAPPTSTTSKGGAAPRSVQVSMIGMVGAVVLGWVVSAMSSGLVFGFGASVL